MHRIIVALLIVGGIANAAPRASDAAAAQAKKRAVIAKRLAAGGVGVLVDCRKPGVVAPPDHDSDAAMRLDFQPAQTQLGQDAIRGVASVDGHSFDVVVPWPAVYFAIDTRGVESSWAADKPADLEHDMISHVTFATSSEPKRAVVERMLEIRATLITLDARRPGVVVPAEFRRESALLLRIGHRLVPEIPDLVVDDTGISGTLAFHGKPFHVQVPWPALYAAAIESYARGVEWPADIPNEHVDPSKCFPSSPPLADAEVRRACERSCLEGSSAGCRILAVELAAGTGGPRDRIRARIMFEQACTGKDAEGCFALGQDLERSEAPRDRARALDHYRHGCDLGSISACDVLAQRLEAAGDPRGSAAAIVTLCAAPRPAREDELALVAARCPHAR